MKPIQEPQDGVFPVLNTLDDLLHYLESVRVHSSDLILLMYGSARVSRRHFNLINSDEVIFQHPNSAYNTQGQAIALTADINYALDLWSLDIYIKTSPEVLQAASVAGVAVITAEVFKDDLPF